MVKMIHHPASTNHSTFLLITAVGFILITVSVQATIASEPDRTRSDDPEEAAI